MAVEQDRRAQLINGVKTPINFLVLGLLMVDGTVAGMAAAFSDFRALLVWTVILSLPAFMVTVIFLAIWRPEALRGVRPLQTVYARQLASDIFLALDGSLSNLVVGERIEAWTTLADVISTDTGADVIYHEFCVSVASRLRQLANLGQKRALNPGPVDDGV